MNKHWCVSCLAIFLGALPVLAQDDAAARTAAGCGPSGEMFNVQKTDLKHPVGQTEQGKALVYFFCRSCHPTAILFESTCNLVKRFAAGVKAVDIFGCVDDPDAIPASRDLAGRGAHGDPLAIIWVVAIARSRWSPHVPYSYGDLYQ